MLIQRKVALTHKLVTNANFGFRQFRLNVSGFDNV